MPDRITIRKIEELMRKLNAIPQSDTRFARAQERLEELRGAHRSLAAGLTKSRSDANAADRKASMATPTIGAPAAFGLGFARGALGGGAYDVEPENKANMRLASDPAYAADVTQRQVVEDAALAQHPVASFAGEITPLAVQAGASGLMGAKALANAVRTTTPREFFGLPKWARTSETQVVSAPTMTKPGVTTRTVTPSPKPAPDLNTPTFIRRGGKAAKDISSQAQKAPTQATPAPKAADVSAAPSANAELNARARIFRQEGFSASDAMDMARQGVKVQRKRLEKILGKKLPGTQQWI